MEAKGCSGHFLAYNTYATPPTTNPLFQGFSIYQNVNKEIISKNSQTLVNFCFGVFFYDNCGKITYSKNIYMHRKGNYDSTKKDKTYGRENGKRKFGVPYFFEVQCR